MRSFGFLSFGHYKPGSPLDAKQMLSDAVDIAVGADEIGVNGAYFRVHHFAPQAGSPMPLLATIAAKTKHIEVGTGVIDMRYENPLYLAEEAAALDLLSDGRVALGVSRGSPEPAERGYEAFGYTGSTDPRGADIGREKFPLFMKGVRGEGIAQPVRQSSGFPPSPADENGLLRLEPHSPGLHKRIWWGAGSRDTAVWAAQQGVNLMSSTLVTEATGASLSELQLEQINLYKQEWKKAGHGHTPKVSVSRSIFPIVNATDAAYFGLRGQASRDQVGIIDGLNSTFGKTYAAEPDKLVEQLKKDEAFMAADTVMLTIPSQLGPEYNLHILEAFAKHVAPELGWVPAHEGPAEGYPLD